MLKIKALYANNLFLFSLLLLCCTISRADSIQNNLQNNSQDKAYIAIIIDDLGYKYKQDKRAINLSKAVTLSFLPHTPYANSLLEIANKQGNDTMLHLPMQAFMETNYLGPGALTSDMNEEEFKRSVKKSIVSLPHIKGVNNHMGSLITSNTKAMKWLMDELVKTGLYFVDSRTTVETVAEKTASDYQINNTRRNVFLDNELNRPAIEFQFNRLIRLAKKNGSAVAIGHPHRETLKLLEEKIPQLKAAGIKLVPVSQLIHKQILAKLKQKPRNITHTYMPAKIISN